MSYPEDLNGRLCPDFSPEFTPTLCISKCGSTHVITRLHRWEGTVLWSLSFHSQILLPKFSVDFRKLWLQSLAVPLLHSLLNWADLIQTGTVYRMACFPIRLLHEVQVKRQAVLNENSGDRLSWLAQDLPRFSTEAQYLHRSPHSGKTGTVGLPKYPKDRAA